VTEIVPLLDASEWLPPLPVRDAQPIAEMVSECTGAAVYVRSVAAGAKAVWAVGRRKGELLLFVVHDPDAKTPAKRLKGEERTLTVGDRALTLRVCPTDHANAVELRKVAPFASPIQAGPRRSFGFGDRLGNATPGHCRAVNGTGLFPVLAQQSMREMARSGRTPEQVLDSASWGAFQAGLRTGFGADADHLKTLEDVDLTAAAGFVMFTADPGDHVDGGADRLNGPDLQTRFEALPWSDLRTTSQDLLREHEGRTVPLGESEELSLDRGALMRAAVKYGKAVAHAAGMYRRLKRRLRKRAFEFEMSVDETDTPTAPAEHAFVTLELRRLGVTVASLAPRFVGRFEKGVDYQGDLDEFARCVRQHAAVARALGPYKLSIHSGSDKFSIYPVIAEAAGDLVHVKTAGTSYLEALRVTAAAEPELFREVMGLALERYDSDKRSYHVSARPDRLPEMAAVSDAGLPELLESFDARQILHVTYGSVLTAEAAGQPTLKSRLLAALDRNEELYADALYRHLSRHVDPFRTE